MLDTACHRDCVDQHCSEHVKSWYLDHPDYIARTDALIKLSEWQQQCRVNRGAIRDHFAKHCHSGYGVSDSPLVSLRNNYYDYTPEADHAADTEPQPDPQQHRPASNSTPQNAAAETPVVIGFDGSRTPGFLIVPYITNRTDGTGWPRLCE